MNNGYVVKKQMVLDIFYLLKLPDKTLNKWKKINKKMHILKYKDI